jgi:hypothetical protein
MLMLNNRDPLDYYYWKVSQGLHRLLTTQFTQAEPILGYSRRDIRESGCVLLL